MKPPPLRNDCFALPPGVSWTPVDEALDRLKQSLSPVTGIQTVPLDQAAGRVLAVDVVALAANPPQANAAVDGYGFAGGVDAGQVADLPLCPGRSAAGEPFQGIVPPGQALRILTGATLPSGVDSVVLEEDCAISATQIAFHGPLRQGVNTRRAGEDFASGDIVATKGTKLRPGHVGLLAAAGLGAVQVHEHLRVGILSTGDELVEAGEPVAPGKIFDANRPMLVSLIRSWGHQACDLGRVHDDRDAVRAALSGADVDVILTSGGASAGDEDHVSALLRAEGNVHSWRIAMKPGRPLLMGQWGQVPVFGLPGNPVAAFVCAMIFARPALSVLAGGNWCPAAGFVVPAAFSKSKKPGRREYLRARLNADGMAEVFHSEGSGRISGLGWATGLVELGDEAAEIGQGDPVRFLPFDAS